MSKFQKFLRKKHFMQGIDENRESNWYIPGWILWMIATFCSFGLLMFFTSQDTDGRFGVLPILYELRHEKDLGGFISLGLVVLLQVFVMTLGFRCLLKRQFLLGIVILLATVCLDIPLFLV